MPELKHTFTGGKMEKDKDERIVPNGQYREALNISVATSEDSDVGAAQNILGNIKVTQAIRGRTQTTNTPSGLVNSEYAQNNANNHVAEIVDPKTDMLYRFIHTVPTGAPPGGEGVWMDRIVEYDTTKSLDVNWQFKENAVMVDIFKVVAVVTYNQAICSNGNRMQIKIDKNLNQVRWGMRVAIGNMITGAGPDAFVEDVDYQTGIITIDKVYTADHVGTTVVFYGDRNLNFSPDRIITGLNILDGMLFWTDNYSEPKKIDIERSKMGSDTSLWVNTTGLKGRYTSNPPPKIDDFNQHTVLLVDEKVQYDLYKDESICPIPGCTNPIAYNYAPSATVDDGSCCLIRGCMDSSACNYDALACEDDGTCCYIQGCMDPNYEEYTPDACCQGDECQTPIAFGCGWGYQTDSCSDRSFMIQNIDDDIFNPSNSFEVMNITTGLYDEEMMIDSVLQWFSLNGTSTSIESMWFMERCTGCSYGGWNYSDGICSWEGIEGVITYGIYSTYTLEKKNLGPWKLSDCIIRDNSGGTPGADMGAAALLGNSSGVSIMGQVCFSNAGCNSYSLFDTIDDVITFLRNHSVFDGTFNAYDGSGGIIPIPAVTSGMTWDNIKMITETTYSFIPLTGCPDCPVHLGNWNF